MEKSKDRELWVGYLHPVNKTKSVRWFASDSEGTAAQKAEAFMANKDQCRSGKVVDGAKTAEEAIRMYVP